METRIQQTTLTPELAQLLLAKRHPRQRRPATGTVAIYAHEMETGRWRPNVPDPLLIDPEGQMFNGGHRCAAVVESGVSIEVLISYGADPTLFDVIDVGRKRAAYQFITEPEASVRAHAARVMLWYRRRFNVPLNARGIAYFDMAELLVEADRVADELGQALPIARHLYQFTNIPIGIGAAVLVLSVEDGISWDELSEFRDGVISMADLAANDPRRVLAERMRQTRHRDRRRQPMEDWTILVRSLNHFLLREPSVLLQMTQLWPRIRESEAEFNKRRIALVNAKRLQRTDRIAVAKRAG